MNNKFFIMIPIIILLTGCYNYRDLNDLAIVSGISVAISGSEYEITIEVVNPKKQTDAASSDEPDFVIYKSKAASIGEAIRKVNLESPKQLYISHMNLLIIDESIAKEHLADVLDYFARNPEVRNEFYVMIGKDKDILSVTTPLENISAENILDTLKLNGNYLGYTNMVTYQDLLYHYLNPYLELAISSIDINGNKDLGSSVDNIKNTEREASSIISGIAIFKNNKLVGYLNNEDALVYNLVTNQANNFSIRTNYESKSFFVTEILQENTNIKIDIYHKKISIYLNGSAMLSEENIINNLGKSETTYSFEDDMNHTLEDMVLDSVSKTIKKYHTDIYGFQNIIYQKYPNYIKTLKGSWNDEVLSQFSIDVTSSIKIVEQGNLNGGICYEKK